MVQDWLQLCVCTFSLYIPLISFMPLFIHGVSNTCGWEYSTSGYDAFFAGYLSRNSRFDGPIHPMADLEMFFPMDFFWWFLFRGHSRTILAWLRLWQPLANFFIGEIPRWPPNDVLHICNIYLFHKTWSVIHVIRGFRGQGIHFWWYYVHLILS